MILNDKGRGYSGTPADSTAPAPSNNSPNGQPNIFRPTFSINTPDIQLPGIEQLGVAFGDVMSNFAGMLQSLMGGGGRGGKGGKGAIDRSEQFGLKRDEVTAQRDYLNRQFGNSERDFGFQQQSLDLQKQQANQNKALSTEQLLGSSAARGSTTTAGIGTQQHNLDTQFQNLMSRLGIQQGEMNLGHEQTLEKFGYQGQRNDFARQGLDIAAGQAGYQNPFSNPNPTPLQKK